MASVVVELSISAEEYLKRYRNPGAVVISRSRDGRRVQFPANLLQRFVTHSGVSGTFEISFDPQGKFDTIKRLA